MRLFNIALSSLAMGAVAIVSVMTIPVARAARQAASVFDVLSADPRFTTTMRMMCVAGSANLRGAAGKDINFDAKTMEVKWVAPNGEARSVHVDGRPIVASNGVVYPVDTVVGE